MLKDVSPAARSGTTGKARRLRRRMTLPEVLLWQRLRGAPGGCKFRRQHPSGPYILDFYCSDARLAIEIDGQGHGSRIIADERRDRWFADADLTTLRIAASDILRDADRVAESVLATAVARLPLHHPAAPGGPPPRAKLGEDL